MIEWMIPPLIRSIQLLRLLLRGTSQSLYNATDNATPAIIATPRTLVKATRSYNSRVAVGTVATNAVRWPCVGLRRRDYQHRRRRALLHFCREKTALSSNFFLFIIAISFTKLLRKVFIKNGKSLFSWKKKQNFDIIAYAKIPLQYLLWR